MAFYNPPPPVLTTFGTTTTDTDTAIYTNGATTAQQDLHSSSSSTSTSIIIVIIVISSAIIVSASIYLLLRFFSRRCNRSFPSQNGVVSDRFNENRHHVICFESDKFESLPSFTFSSSNIPSGDCAVCLSKFEAPDHLRLLPSCGHVFHAECIDAWLKTNLTCPLCRSMVLPTEDDVTNKSLSVSGGANGRINGGIGGINGGIRNNSFRIEIGSVSRRRTPSDSGRRSYSIGSYEYVVDDGYEIPVDSTHRGEIEIEIEIDKDSVTPEPPGESLTAEIGDGGGSGRLNWLHDYVDRVSVSISSRSQSFRSSGRFFTGSSRRSETVDDYEAGRVGEEISELFRWLSGV